MALRRKLGLLASLASVAAGARGTVSARGTIQSTRQCSTRQRQYIALQSPAPDDGEILQQEFEQLAADAIASGQTLELGGMRVQLHEPFKLTSTESLCVRGGRIVGDGHALFTVGGSRSGLLELNDCTLSHKPSAARSEKCSLGAAILVRGKGRLALRNCHLSSEAGFALWLVQKASASAVGCVFPGSGRSTICAFENAQLELEACTLSDAKPHAVCARGDTRITLRRCTLEGSELRAIYCYHSSALDMSDCSVSRTRSPDSAAIQMDALRPQDQARVSLRNTRFNDNAGGDLSIAGNVVRDVTGCAPLVERTPELHGALAARERDAGYGLY
ncbi:hypothetical protein T492DRAFT_1002903 [Pavlovales sp. CCMP2436]|nr:hypothetical protein T492DRAFT_1002903 [Pavlovales sp. CCMP2436]